MSAQMQHPSAYSENQYTGGQVVRQKLNHRDTTEVG
jgi:hypothetical protein